MSGLDTLRQLIGRHARNTHGPSPIEGLMITATDAPTVPLAAVAEPSLGLVVQGGKRTVSGDRVFDYAAGEFLVSQLDLPVIGQVTAASAGRPFLGIGIRLAPAEIAAMLLEAGSAVGAGPAVAPGIAVASADEPLLNAGASGRPARRPAGRADSRAPVPARGALAAVDRAARRGRASDRVRGREPRSHHPHRAVDP
jgi:AraC-type transcriptional regulator N-terminus